MKKRMFWIISALALALCACATDEKMNVQENLIVVGQNDEIMEEESTAQNLLETEKQNEQSEEGEKIENEESEESVEKEQIEYNDNVSDDKSQTIEGFQLVDGQEVPVNVTFEVTNIQRGDEAYNILAQKGNIVEATNDMEYIIITIEVTYNSGGTEELFMAENDSSLQSARLKFTLSNGDSNAEDVTMYLSDSIYDLSIPNSSNDRGSVAFLRQKDSNEPLVFSGFNSTISFVIDN